MGLVALLVPDLRHCIAQEKVEPQRIGIWNGRAAVGDGQVQEAEVWITVHRPVNPNGMAVVNCPGGGYKGPMWDAWQEKSLTWLAELKLVPRVEDK
jgi:hypothetical protein